MCPYFVVLWFSTLPLGAKLSEGLRVLIVELPRDILIGLIRKMIHVNLGVRNFTHFVVSLLWQYVSSAFIAGHYRVTDEALLTETT